MIEVLGTFGTGLGDTACAEKQIPVILSTNCGEEAEVSSHPLATESGCVRLNNAGMSTRGIARRVGERRRRFARAGRYQDRHYQGLSLQSPDQPNLARNGGVVRHCHSSSEAKTAASLNEKCRICGAGRVGAVAALDAAGHGAAEVYAPSATFISASRILRSSDSGDTCHSFNTATSGYLCGARPCDPLRRSLQSSSQPARPE